MIWYYLIPFGVFSAISMVMFFIMNKKAQALNNKKAIFFYLAFSLVIATGGLISMAPAASRSMPVFFGLQLAYFALGYLASYLYKKNAPASLSQYRYGGVAFVLANTFLGMLLFTLVYYYFSPGELAAWFAFSVLPFLLPEFISTSLNTYRSIPEEIHKVWYFPIHADEVDYDTINTDVIYMLELEYTKNINDGRLTNTKLRAPVEMKFGDWFRSFIESHNYKFEADPIQYLNYDQTPLGWMFYIKPSALSRTRFIDAELSITDNKIGEKDIIIAKRVGLVEDEEEY
jgi:hypothetical protein